jgi:Uma2 family endonuclease
MGIATTEYLPLSRVGGAVGYHKDKTLRAEGEPMTVTLAKWSIADYHQMIEGGVLIDRHVELLNGAIVEMPPEGVDHAQSSTDARDVFYDKLRGRALVRDAKPITLPDQGSEPEPDLAIVAPQREVYKTLHHPYPEEIFLLVEYSSTSLAKDRELKRQLYAQAGIQEYWIVNLEDREVIIYRNPAEGDYQSVTTVRSGAITLLAFPDVAIGVNELL